jgi:hypothetical protein
VRLLALGTDLARPDRRRLLIGERASGVESRVRSQETRREYLATAPRGGHGFICRRRNRKYRKITVTQNDGNKCAVPKSEKEK